MLWHAIAPVRRYTKVSHDVMRHPRLNSDAKVLISYVQGLPEGEQSDRALSEHAREVGIKGRRYQTAKEQLVVNGFVHEHKAPGARGLWATHQLFSNVPLSDADARAVWREAGVGGGVAAGGGTEAAPSAQVPTVGQPRARSVGHQLPVDEELGENSFRPPTQAAESEAALEALSPEEAQVERVLLSLRECRRDLRLGVAEARSLVALAVEWLRRGVSGAELRQVLSSGLPSGRVRSAVGFLRHRLVQKMPEAPAPEPAPVPEPTPEPACVSEPAPEQSPPPPVVVAPLVTCEGPGNEHVFRAYGGATLCPDCQQTAAWARWAERRAADLGVDLAEDAAKAVEAGRDPEGWRSRLAAAAAAGGVPEQ
ncbi:hypothetical protein [Streptomyces cyaneofuscatus]|uniref:Helix-turn-helix domain-containing protein n=1 Tax=Streptomyces cyaneofuscatus TaxID=66883 RepID=A0ABZ1EXE6_9ACTN|nr:hypothetical protein [Streptomyces cyaneofuscatus]WSB08777.1 hypothetical protein OG849_16730 [Streptomyces cyaneofuscatus]WSD47689.1 hypothetical protein OG857_18675 [Streptomyces cyaneofuscatus]WTA91043.1 hypothetical protein OG323_19565 [Streptomyces cyaneofuscatus]